MQKLENQTAMAKARLAAIGADRIAKCKRFMEVVPTTSSWGRELCDEGQAVLEQLNLDGEGKELPYSDRVDTYDIKKVLESILGEGYDTDLLNDHNTEVKKKIKKSKYLKKVPAGDPLRAGLDEGQVCYEFTDAMFDDHIDVFTDVLFIGHQFRVVKDEDGAYYRVERLSRGRWNYVTFEDKLYDVIVALPGALKHREERAVEGAVRQAERGALIFDEQFTTDEIRELAEAKGIELPQESTFSVVQGWTRSSSATRFERTTWCWPLASATTMPRSCVSSSARSPNRLTCGAKAESHQEHGGAVGLAEARTRSLQG